MTLFLQKMIGYIQYVCSSNSISCPNQELFHSQVQFVGKIFDLIDGVLLHKIFAKAVYAYF